MKIRLCPDREYQSAPLRSVLFVCTGNICRSPVAEHLLRSLLPEKSPIEALSAGVYALEGNQATSQAVSAAGEMGLDLSDHRARSLNRDRIRRADLILAMESAHCEHILRLEPDAERKVFALGCFSSKKDVSGPRDIEDPYGASMNQYRRCFEKIRECVENLTVFIFSGEKPETDGSRPTPSQDRKG